MRKSLCSFTLIAFVFVTCAKTGFALRCYECKSFNDTNCRDPFEGQAKTVECFRSPENSYLACFKKTWQNGNIERTCQDQRHYDAADTICQNIIRGGGKCRHCNSDFCNSAENILPTIFVTMLTAIGVIFSVN